MDGLVHPGEGLQKLLDVLADCEELPVVLHHGLHQGLRWLLPLAGAYGDSAQNGGCRMPSPPLPHPSDANEVGGILLLIDIPTRAPESRGA